MLQVDVSSDIDRAIAEVGQFARTQIPFSTSRALNDTIFDVRKVVVEVTYPKAFTVRNRAFPGRLFRVTARATKRRLEAVLGQTLDREYIERHVTGGVKRGRTGGRVAIPTTPDAMRSKTGRIRAPLKPARLAGRKDIFVIERGSSKFIIRRGRGGRDNELLYSIKPSADIQPRFRFYSDAERVTLRVFSGHWNNRMSKAILTSRFT